MRPVSERSWWWSAVRTRSNRGFRIRSCSRARRLSTPAHCKWERAAENRSGASAPSLRASSGETEARLASLCLCTPVRSLTKPDSGQSTPSPPAQTSQAPVLKPSAEPEISVRQACPIWDADLALLAAPRHPILSRPSGPAQRPSFSGPLMFWLIHEFAFVPLSPLSLPQQTVNACSRGSRPHSPV